MNYWIAFSAGLLTFFSPCFLPLVPAYLIYLTGLSLEEIKTSRVTTVVHSLLFILGFTIVFTILGFGANQLGRFFVNSSALFRIAGGFLLIFLGIYFLGILKIPFLDLERKFVLTKRPSGYLGSIFIGMVFALGWTPCIGPILATILVLAANSQTAYWGGALLLTYSLGIGLPLLITSIAVNYSLGLIKKIQEYFPLLHKVSGGLLIFVGLLLIFNYLQVLTVWLIRVTGYQGI
ncbi:MAG: cytochrome c biogenesis protein CcdA [bacterium]